MIETVITREGLERLKGELAELSTVRRNEIAERIRTASRAEANAIENVDLQGAREDQVTLERRIALLKGRISQARVVEPNGRNGVVDLGERVQLRDLDRKETVEYHVVGSHEADPLAQRISVASPVGRALLGRRRGDIAVVDAPKGRFRFEILSIRSGGIARPSSAA